MIKVRARLKQKRLKGIIRRLPDKFNDAHAAIGIEAQDYLERALSMPYPPASAPGNYPAMRTGDLRESVDISFTGARTFTAVISASVPYAKHLEYGTRKMAARPFMRPTAAWIRRNARKILTDELDNLT